MNFKTIFLVILVFATSLSFYAKAAEPDCRDKTIVILGDSLVAGFGLNSGEAFPERLVQTFNDEGVSFEIVNAGVSGDTTAGGLSRLDWSVPEGTDGVILELGANDALRGISPGITAANLKKIIERLQAKNTKVLLAGMLAPPNMGQAYGEEFNGIFEKLAAEHNLLLYPFFLDGVAGEPSLNQPDGMHPTAEGVNVIVEKFLPTGLEFAKSICEG